MVRTSVVTQNRHGVLFACLDDETASTVDDFQCLLDVCDVGCSSWVLILGLCLVTFRGEAGGTACEFTPQSELLFFIVSGSCCCLVHISSFPINSNYNTHHFYFQAFLATLRGFGVLGFWGFGKITFLPLFVAEFLITYFKAFFRSRWGVSFCT